MLRLSTPYESVECSSPPTRIDFVYTLKVRFHRIDCHGRSPSPANPFAIAIRFASFIGLRVGVSFDGDGCSVCPLLDDAAVRHPIFRGEENSKNVGCAWSLSPSTIPCRIRNQVRRPARTRNRRPKPRFLITEHTERRAIRISRSFKTHRSENPVNVFPVVIARSFLPAHGGLCNRNNRIPL